MRHSKETKSYVTEYAFEVSPDLLGKALATPVQRFLALSVDLILAAVFTQLGSISLGAIVALLFYIIIKRKASASRWRRVLRKTTAFTGAFVLFWVTVGILEYQQAKKLEQLFSNQTWTDSETGEADLATIGDLMEAQGVTDSQDPEKLAKAMEQIARTASQRTQYISNADSLTDKQKLTYLRDYLQAKSANDSAAIATTLPQARMAIAGSTLAERDWLNNQVDRLQEEKRALQQQIENPSFFQSLRALLADFGLSLGWVGIYFTLALAYWQGQTPGKRLLNLKVVRLNGKPLTFWHSFERFAGYAAGLATGLLGFAQSYWDPNRQAIHDKIAGTVVLNLKRPDRHPSEIIDTDHSEEIS
jgi:hypothetical protein